MSLASIHKGSLNFLERQIFTDLTFQVEPGDRVALIGPNGAGKTTLLRILNGDLPLDQGEVRIAKGTRVGYLPQDVQETASGPLLDSVVDSIPNRLELRERVHRIENELAHARSEKQQVKRAQELAELHQEMSHLELQFPPHEAEKILTGLGFDVSDFAEPVSTLSGGWKMRAALAALLYQRPDLLLMDEPTNHLDIPSVHWLEQFLKEFDGAMVVVSHDRDFLNRQVDRVVSLEPEGVRSYSGNYDFYLKARTEEEKALEARERNQEQKVKEAERFIERFRAKASKARQAQSKIKLLKKMEMVETHQRPKSIHFSFPEAARSGRVTLTMQNVAKRFGEKTVYQDVSGTILRGERVAVIGPNGCGKTTLLKMVAGEIRADRGSMVLGHGVELGYFAQHHSEMLDPRKTVIEEVYQVVPQETVGFVRNVCGAFLFSGSDVEKPIGVLSGGERARVSLAKLLVKPGNFMVMDEPTNHLDLLSSEKLIEALCGFSGTLLFVSHNQSFINRLATKIWDIQNGEITEYPGSLDEYYDHLERTAPERERIREAEAMEAKRESSSERRAPAGAKSKKDRKAEKRERARLRQQVRETLAPLQAEVEELEERIASLEGRQKEVETLLADPELFRDEVKSIPLLKEHTRNRDELEELLRRWEKGQARLEKAKEKMAAAGSQDIEDRIKTSAS